MQYSKGSGNSSLEPHEIDLIKLADLTGILVKPQILRLVLSGVWIFIYSADNVLHSLKLMPVKITFKHSVHTAEMHILSPFVSIMEGFAKEKAHQTLCNLLERQTSPNIDMQCNLYSYSHAAISVNYSSHCDLQILLT
jgi:hypothetical protein